MTTDLFDEELEMPDRRARERLNALVGLDDVKTVLAKNAVILLDPNALTDWSSKQHGQVLPLVTTFAHRTPLFLLAGDVGTGKTTLAETFASQIASDRGITIAVLRLSLRSRGSGAVGEMTRLLGEAFDEVIKRGRHLPPGSALVLIIDEADAIAQSRELSQMHHEDRAGVNALIRGIDTVAAEGLPIVVVMCTNRLGAIDPAVRRRAVAQFEFHRPDQSQRVAVITAALQGTGIPPQDIDRLAELAGDPDDSVGYGHTYSDLMHRVLPAAVLNAFPDQRLTAQAVADAIRANPPTPPFKDE